MSEVTGPPKDLKPVLRVPEITKHDQKPDDQKPPQGQDQPVSKQSKEGTHLSRDPAVSLSASMGHIALGENIAGSITTIDADGRPILITDEATFALTPDVGLKEGDSITLNIVTTDHKLKAELIIRNGTPEDPPVLLTMTLVSVKHITQGTIKAPETEPRYIDSETGAYIPPSATPSVTQETPQTSLSSGIYQQSTTLDVSAAKERLTKETGALLPKDQSLLKDKITFETKQPSDPTMVQASATDMAALLATQQSNAPKPEPTLKVDARPGSPMPAQPVVSKADSQSKVETADVKGTPKSTPVQTDNIQSTQKPASPDGAPLKVDTRPPHVPTRPASPEASGTAPDTASKAGGKPTTVPVDNSAPLAPQPTAAIISEAKTEQVLLPAQFIPNSEAQALLQKASISVVGPKADINIALRAKLVTDPPNTVEAKILSTQAHPAPAAEKIQAGENSGQVIKDTLETSEKPRQYTIVTSAGTVELSLSEDRAPPAQDSVISIIPAAVIDIMPIQGKSVQTAALSPLSLLTKGMKKWPALRQVHTLLSDENTQNTIGVAAGQQLSQALAGRTAAGGAKLTNSLLFMLSALKQGNTSNWLGPQIENYLTQANQKPLLDILKQDIMRFANLINRPAGGEWQPIVLPLAADDNSPLMALLIRPEQQHQEPSGQKKSEDDEKEQEDPTRFILEVHLSALGAIQLDGFIKGKTFDIKFKSHTALAEPMKNDIRGLFSTALDASGYNGSITFSDMPVFSVNVENIINKAEPLPHESRNA